MARLIRQRKLQAREAKGHETQQKSLEGLFQKLQNFAIGKERDAQLVKQEVARSEEMNKLNV